MEQIASLVLGQLCHQRAVQPVEALTGMAVLIFAGGRHIDLAVQPHTVFRQMHLGEYVTDVARRLNVQICLPIKAAIGHIVDDMTKGRDIQALPAVQTHRQQVFLLRQLPSQVNDKGRVAAVMLFQQHTVQVYLCTVACGLKGQPQGLPCPCGLCRDHSLIAGNHLVDGFIKIVIGCFRNGMGQPNCCPLLSGHGEMAHFLGIHRGKHPAVIEIEPVTKLWIHVAFLRQLLM